VQPRDDGLGAASHEVLDRGIELGPRLWREDPFGQLVVERVVDVGLVFAFGDHDVEGVTVVEALDEVAAGHRVAAAEQADRRQAAPESLSRGRVRDVKERQLDRALNVLLGGVDRVAGQQEEVGAGGLESVGLFGEQAADEVPAPRALVALDLREVGLGHLRALRSAVLCRPVAVPRAVDRAVVDDRARPGDAADDANGLHDGLPSCSQAPAMLVDVVPSTQCHKVHS
jgi:hypothetical protein